MTPIEGAHAYLTRILPPWCHSAITPAVAGDVDAIETLMVRAPNANRGEVVAALWQAGVDAPALRAAVEAGWDHDHGEMLFTFGRCRLISLFRAAAFPVEHLPDPLTVWRGGLGHPHFVARGLAWTRDRDCACWFAMRFAGLGLGEPVVLRRTIRRRAVLAHINTRDENEIVTASTAPAEVDGDDAGWRAAAACVEARHEAANAAFIAECKAASAVEEVAARG